MPQAFPIDTAPATPDQASAAKLGESAPLSFQEPEAPAAGGFTNWVSNLDPVASYKQTTLTGSIGRKILTRGIDDATIPQYQDPSFNVFNERTPDFIQAHPWAEKWFESHDPDSIPNKDAFFNLVARKDQQDQDQARYEQASFGSFAPGLVADTIALGGVGKLLQLGDILPSAGEGLQALSKIGTARSLLMAAAKSGTTMVALNEASRALSYAPQDSGLDRIKGDTYAFGLGAGLGGLFHKVGEVGQINLAQQQQGALMKAIAESGGIRDFAHVQQEGVDILYRHLSEPATSDGAATIIRTPETLALIGDVMDHYEKTGFKFDALDHPGQGDYDHFGPGGTLDTLQQQMEKMVPKTGPISAALGAAAPGSRMANAGSYLDRILHRVYFSEVRPTAETVDNPVTTDNYVSGELRKSQHLVDSQTIDQGMNTSLRQHFKDGGQPFTVDTAEGPVRIARSTDWEKLGAAVDLHRQNLWEEARGGDPAPDVHPLVADAQDKMSEFYQKRLGQLEGVGQVDFGPDHLADATSKLEEMKSAVTDPLQQTPKQATEIGAQQDKVDAMQKQADQWPYYANRRWLRDEVWKRQGELADKMEDSFHQNRATDFYTGKPIEPDTREIIPEALDRIKDPHIRELIRGSTTEGEIGTPARNAANEATRQAREKAQEEPEITPGMKRLYRGETEDPNAKGLSDWLKEDPKVKATIEATGRWFYGSRKEAADFSRDFGNGKVSYADVPESQYESLRASNQPDAGKFSAGGASGERAREEFFVSKETAEARRPLSQSSDKAESAQQELQHVQDLIDSGELKRQYLAAVADYGKAISKAGVKSLLELDKFSGFSNIDVAGSNPMQARVLNEIDEKQFSDFLDNDARTKMNKYDQHVSGRIGAGEAVQAAHAQLAPMVKQLTGEEMDPAAPDHNLIMKASRAGWAQMNKTIEPLAESPAKAELQRLFQAAQTRSEAALPSKINELLGQPQLENQGLSANWRRAQNIYLRSPIAAFLGSSILTHLNTLSSSMLTNNASGVLSQIAKTILSLKDGEPFDHNSLAASMADDGRTPAELAGVPHAIEREAPEPTGTGRAMQAADKLSAWSARKVIDWSGMNYMTTLRRRVFSQQLMQDFFDGLKRMKGAQDLIDGGVPQEDAIGKSFDDRADAVKLSRLGLSGNHAASILESIQKHGVDATTGQPLADLSPEEFAAHDQPISPEFANWTKAESPMRDRLAAAINGEVNNLEAKPSLTSRPLMNNTFLGKMFNQFWAYHLAWGNQTLQVAGQSPGSQQASYFGMMLFMGALSDALHNQASGRRSFDDTADQWTKNPGGMAYQAFNRAGMLGIGNRFLAAADATPYGPAEKLGNTVASTHTANALSPTALLLGPAGDEANRAFQGFIMPVLSGKGYDAKAKAAAWSAVPFHNLLPMTYAVRAAKSMGYNLPGGASDLIAPNRNAPVPQQ